MKRFVEVKERAVQIVTSLDKHKAEDIRVLEVGDLTSLADYFIIASATSSTHVRSLSDYVEEELGRQGIRPLRVEGYSTSNWVLMDYGSVVVHLFQREARAFYDLERLWKDGKQLETADFIEVRGND